MAITMRELALLQAEVLNAASWALSRDWTVLDIKASALSAAGQRTSTPNSLTHHNKPHPPVTAIHRPFLHILLLDTFPSIVSDRSRQHPRHATLLLMPCIDLASPGRRRATHAPV